MLWEMNHVTRQTKIAIVRGLKPNTSLFITPTHTERLCPPRNTKTTPNFRRILAINHYCVMSIGAALFLTLRTKFIGRGAAIDQHALSIQREFKKQRVGMGMPREGSPAR